MFDLETICTNSFRNFHTKGFDYLCLTRTPELTRKVYFFDGRLADLPELVVPHDHRYPFTTTVLAGAVRNVRFMKLPEASWVQPERVGDYGFIPFDRFDYRTPLNGGDGFTWAGNDFLKPEESYGSHTRGRFYRSSATDIHTLDIRCEGTVIMLEQMADVVPLDTPTHAWRREGDKTPPSVSGLYDRMTPDHARARIEQFLDLIGNR